MGAAHVHVLISDTVDLPRWDEQHLCRPSTGGSATDLRICFVTLPGCRGILSARVRLSPAVQILTCSSRTRAARSTFPTDARYQIQRALIGPTPDHSKLHSSWRNITMCSPCP